MTGAYDRDNRWGVQFGLGQEAGYYHYCDDRIQITCKTSIKFTNMVTVRDLALEIHRSSHVIGTRDHFGFIHKTSTSQRA